MRDGLLVRRWVTRRGDCGATRRPGCVIPGLRGCLLCSVAVAARVLADTGADAPPGDVLAQALAANRQLARLAEELRAENARLREEAVRRDAELEQVKAALAELQRMVFGRSSERSRPEAAGRDGDGEGAGGDGDRAGGGPRRDYPMIGLDNYPDAAVMPRSGPGGGVSAAPSSPGRTPAARGTRTPPGWPPPSGPSPPPPRWPG